MMRSWDNIREILLEIDTLSRDTGIFPSVQHVIGSLIERNVLPSTEDLEILASKYVNQSKSSWSGYDILLSLSFEGMELLVAMQDEQKWAEIKDLSAKNGVYLTADLIILAGRHLAREKMAEKAGKTPENWLEEWKEVANMPITVENGGDLL